MLTNRTRVALVHLLQSLSDDACRLLFLKHFDRDLRDPVMGDLLEAVEDSPPDQVATLLIELVGNTTSIRTDAPTKHVFDSRRAELERLLRADGFELLDAEIIRVLPAAEPAAQILDYLDEALSTSGLDDDAAIREALEESRSGLLEVPPDYNGATTKARIALETVARKGAAKLAEQRRKPAPKDSWGSAISFLRNEGVITPPEEQALAKMYTLISPGAHVPKGLTDEQWALLSKTFAVSGAYFVLQQFLAA